MKLKFNIYNRYLLRFLYINYINIMKNTHHRSLAGQNRSKLLDFPTIYPSESKIGNLGKII